MNMNEELQEIFDRMPEAFVPRKAAGVKAVIQLVLGGDGGGNWLFKIANGQLHIAPGDVPQPDLTLSMAAQDYVSITKGDVDPKKLFMGGKIKVQGNMGLAFKFQEMFDKNQVLPQ